MTKQKLPYFVSLSPGGVRGNTSDPIDDGVHDIRRGVVKHHPVSVLSLVQLLQQILRVTGKYTCLPNPLSFKSILIL